MEGKQPQFRKKELTEVINKLLNKIPEELTESSIIGKKINPTRRTEVIKQTLYQELKIIDWERTEEKRGYKTANPIMIRLRTTPESLTNLITLLHRLEIEPQEYLKKPFFQHIIITKHLKEKFIKEIEVKTNINPIEELPLIFAEYISSEEGYLKELLESYEELKQEQGWKYAILKVMDLQKELFNDQESQKALSKILTKKITKKVSEFLEESKK